MLLEFNSNKNVIFMRQAANKMQQCVMHSSHSFKAWVWRHAERNTLCKCRRAPVAGHHTIHKRSRMAQSQYLSFNTDIDTIASASYETTLTQM
jgi:hypothetical protein